MKRKIRKFVSVAVALLALIYIALLFIRGGNPIPTSDDNMDTSMHGTIAILGATGTIGDGLLKAAMNDPDVEKIHVITRRKSPRIEAGVASGKITVTIHKNYLDYSAVQDVLADLDAVYWAIGISSAGVDEKTYAEIHVDYPSRFVTAWIGAGDRENRSFHYVSGSGAAESSRMMWAREKARAEQELAQLAGASGLRVVSYRPSVILPTEAEAHLGHRIAYGILAPIKAAIEAESIGRAMLEVSARDAAFPNGTILENKDVIAVNDTYQGRIASR